MQRITGRHERAFAGSEEVSAFVPLPLPPRDPELAIDNRIAERLRAAEHALARLDLAGEMVPSLDWFIYAFVRKEAVISSQIEGTQATLIDLLTFEADQETAPDADVEEVCNYLEALSYARAELVKPDGLPISMRLLNEAHRRLMHGARGASKQPGEVRRTQNWIGGSRPGNAAYVPPPMQSLPDLLGDLESYLHSSDNLPKLVRIGLAHVQFESIHPYLDGNGRIGRLLIALLLEHWGQLKAPLRSLDAMEEERPVPDPGRFAADGHWKERFARWDTLTPERLAGDRELLAAMSRALDALPPAQRAAIWLRDVEGLEPAAICAALEVSEGNLRVLLHRGRAKLRDGAALLVEERKT